MSSLTTAHRVGTPTPDTPPEPSRDAHHPRRRVLAPLALQLTAMIGIGALLYPTAANWFATRTHDAEISGYTQALSGLTPDSVTQKLQAAQTYNQHVPAGMLRDPYTNSGQDVAQEDADAYSAYEDVMALTGTDAIGTLTYSRLGIALPIHTGTSDETLSRGVGHLYGSSLPVGGTSTHAVLTSHSGLTTASLFTPLLKAQVGDVFRIDTLDTSLYYQVDSIETVLPDDTSSLQIVPGQDLVTLVTCTPLGINSHRLLVHAHRTDAPTDTTGTQAIAGDGNHAGFPWWALIFLAVSGTTAALLILPTHTSRHAGSAARDAGTGTTTHTEDDA